MMGHQPQVQEKLFYTRFNLNQRIPKNHILRKISNMVDFDFVYKEVKDKYGYNGNISVPPPVILKFKVNVSFNLLQRQVRTRAHVHTALSVGLAVVFRL